MSARKIRNCLFEEISEWKKLTLIFQVNLNQSIKTENLATSKDSYSEEDTMLKVLILIAALVNGGE